MNKELIIELLKQAVYSGPNIAIFTMQDLEKFSRLVAEHEREQCAKDCESINSVEDFYGERPELICAGVIRARGNP